MQGTVNESGIEYNWWAGKASPDAKADYCVHCRHGDYGVTRYLSERPNESAAEQMAKELAPMLRQLGH